MKPNILLGIFIVVGLSASTSEGQELTLTTTRANITSHRASIDMPGLSGNPLAIIVATPLGDTEALNPHPIGAWYYADKWNIFNSDSGVMPPGARYRIQFFLRPGPNQFLHTVTQQNLGGEGSYVDHPALNNNPNAQVQILQNHAPDVRSPYNVNRFKARAGYSPAAGRWFIANVGGEPLGRSSAYNVVVAGGGVNTGTNQNVSLAGSAAAGEESCACTSLPPNGNAGGDLSGTYPGPTVQKLSGRPLSNAAPDTGQVLKWDGAGWAPAADNVGAAAGNGPTYTGGLGIELEGNSFNALSTTAMWNASKLAGRDILTTAPTVGQVLKWGGGAWLPGDDNVGGGAAAPALQTYFKNTFEHSPSLGMNGVYVFAQHSHTVTVTKKSRLIISGNFTLLSDGCLGCGVTKMGIDLMVNNAYKATLSSAEIANNSKVAVSVSNYMFDVEPGTYKIQFRATHPWIDGNVAGTADALYSSIIVLPQ